MKNHIAILDFGSQYTHLIARNIRELNVLAKIYPHDANAATLQNASGIILSGGPQAVYLKNSLSVDPKIFELKVPILGICYGHQLIAHLLGGQVKLGKVKEFGRAKLTVLNKTSLFKSLGSKLEVWMSHGDTVTKLPQGFITSGSTDDCPITAMADEKRHIYGLQFHPEVDHTLDQGKIIANFILKICKAEKNWEIKDIVAHLIQKIRQQVKNRKVFVLVSGGVDSNVAFALLTKALGEKKVKGLYIDTGFMRKNESEEIMKNFKKAGFDNLEAIDAKETFYERLADVYDPEKKRNIIGQTFLDIKDEVAKKLKLNSDEWLLGQGTIYPDTIESGATKNADKIKTHHNRVDAIQKMINKGLVVEPLVEFYKYEVREIGKLLKLPKVLIDRHPFPGPGLSIRALCWEKKTGENIQKAKTKISNFYIKNYPAISQTVLPIKSVGVQGDNRTYAHPLAIWKENDWKKLDNISSATTNAVREINRVVLLLNPGEKTKLHLPSQNLFLTPQRVETLRQIDAIVTKNIKEADLYNSIWQFPVVLIPITDGSQKESIVLRPVNTRDVMTLNFYPMKKSVLKKITREILSTKKISYVFYDITNKPPGTTEWE